MQAKTIPISSPAPIAVRAPVSARATFRAASTGLDEVVTVSTPSALMVTRPEACQMRPENVLALDQPADEAVSAAWSIR